MESTDISKTYSMEKSQKSKHVSRAKSKKKFQKEWSTLPQKIVKSTHICKAKSKEKSQINMVGGGGGGGGGGGERIKVMRNRVYLKAAADDKII